MVRRKNVVSGLANQLSLSAYQQFVASPQTLRQRAAAWTGVSPGRAGGARVQLVAPSMPEYWPNMCQKLAGALPRMATPPQSDGARGKTNRQRRQPTKLSSQVANYAPWPSRQLGLEPPKNFTAFAAAKARAAEAVRGTSRSQTFDDARARPKPKATLAIPKSCRPQQPPQPPPQLVAKYKPFNFGKCANCLIDFCDAISSDERSLSPVGAANKPAQHLLQQQQLRGRTPPLVNFTPVSILKKRPNEELEQALRYENYIFGRPREERVKKPTAAPTPQSKKRKQAEPQVYSILRQPQELPRLIESAPPRPARRSPSVVTKPPLAPSQRQVEEEKRLASGYRSDFNFPRSNSKSTDVLKRKSRSSLRMPQEINRGVSLPNLAEQKHNNKRHLVGEVEAQTTWEKAEYYLDALRRLLPDVHQSCETLRARPNESEVTLYAEAQPAVKPTPKPKPPKPRRQLNLNELFQANKLKDLEKNSLWDALMQLVAHMCTEDEDQLSESSGEQRLRAGVEGQRRQKQYSVYLLVTSDEEEEEEEEQEEESTETEQPLNQDMLPAQPIDPRSLPGTSQSSDTTIWNNESQFEQRCSSVYQKEHCRAQLAPKKKKRRANQSRTRAPSPRPPIRTPLHWPKADYSSLKPKGKTRRKRSASTAVDQRCWRMWNSNLQGSNSLNKAYSQLLSNRALPLMSANASYAEMSHIRSRHSPWQ